MDKKTKIDKKEEKRLSKVANWYNPINQKIESSLIEYRAQTIMPLIKGPKILEMGCSMGIMTSFLADNFSDITVIDGSEEYINYTRRKIRNKKLKFIVSLFENYETEEKFDDIIMANILEHVEDPIIVLKKAKSWLKSRGRIHVIVPNAESLHRKIGQKMGLIKKLDDFTSNDKKIGHRRIYSKDSLKKDIEKSGLKIVHYEGIFLKPFSHSQMDKLDKKILDALFQVGKELPDHCSAIYLICKK